MAKCAHCEEDAITNLDGDDLCLRHANEWVHGEGHAAHEAELERKARADTNGDF